MSNKTNIEWTDTTWNPVSGCSKVSPGCAHCYAETVTQRYAGRPGWPAEFLPWTPENAPANVVLHPERLDAPLRWRKPRRVFVNSMSDLFHEQVPTLFVFDVFQRMAAAQQHTFQVLTKRPDRMLDFCRRLSFIAPEELQHLDAPSCSYWPNEVTTNYPARPLPNVWLGVSVENQHWADERIPLLLQTPAAVRFISAEPLLGPVDLSEFLSPLEWSDDETCMNCHGEGEYVTCIDDLCYRQDECIHGDAPTPCRECHGEGEIHHPGRDEAIDWVICGGESGPKRRDMDLAWARSLRDQCLAAGAAFFFKQASGPRPGMPAGESDLDAWKEFPR